MLKLKQSPTVHVWFKNAVTAEPHYQCRDKSQDSGRGRAATTLVMVSDFITFGQQAFHTGYEDIVFAILRMVTLDHAHAA